VKYPEGNIDQTRDSNTIRLYAAAAITKPVQLMM